MQLGLAKLVQLSITTIVAWPGGFIFPLFFIGASFGYAASLLTGLNPTIAMLCLMCSVQVSIARTPWATPLILLVLHREDQTSPNSVVQAFPITIISCMVALFLTRRFHFFSSAVQHSRTDVVFPLLQEQRIRVLEFDEEEIEKFYEPTTLIADNDEDTEDKWRAVRSNLYDPIN